MIDVNNPEYKLDVDSLECKLEEELQETILKIEDVNRSKGSITIKANDVHPINRKELELRGYSIAYTDKDCEFIKISWNWGE